MPDDKGRADVALREMAPGMGAEVTPLILDGEILAITKRMVTNQLGGPDQVGLCRSRNTVCIGILVNASRWNTFWVNMREGRT